MDCHGIITRALLRLERTMNLLEGGWGTEGGEGTEGGWGERVERGRGERGRVGEGWGGRGVEGRDDGYTYCNRYVH